MVYNEGDQLVSWTGMYWYSYDGVGNLVQVENGYYPGSVNQPYQYVGQFGYYTHWMEPDFGLLQLDVRFYDAEVGRFGQRDPVPNGYSPYVYGADSPLVWADPSGKLSLTRSGVWYGSDEAESAARRGRRAPTPEQRKRLEECARQYDRCMKVGGAAIGSALAVCVSFCSLDPDPVSRSKCVAGCRAAAVAATTALTLTCGLNHMNCVTAAMREPYKPSTDWRYCNPYAWCPTPP